MSRSRHTPAANGGKWLRPQTRQAIYHRDGHACVYCGDTWRLGVDHLNSVENQGRNNRPQNLVTACGRCNSSKQHMSLRAWFKKLHERGIDLAIVKKRIRRARRVKLNRKMGRQLAAAKRTPPPEEAPVPVEVAA